MSGRRSGDTAQLSLSSSSKQFESFLRYLARAPSLAEAKRLRNDVEVSLRRARLLPLFPAAAAGSGQVILEPTADTAQERKRIVKYIDRLVQAKLAIDKRIATLGGVAAAAAGVSAAAEERVAARVGKGKGEQLELAEVLSQPGALGFFMEFMDRRRRSMAVQFYLTIEGLKDPLEEQDLALGRNDANPELGFAISDLGKLSDDEPVDAMAALALKEDIALLLATYIIPARVSISPLLRSTLEQYATTACSVHSVDISSSPAAAGAVISAEGLKVGKRAYRLARSAVFAAQREVFNDMKERDWEHFTRSDLYNRAAAEMPARTIVSGLSDSPVQSRNKFAFDGASSSGAMAALPRSRPGPLVRAGTAIGTTAGAASKPQPPLRPVGRRQALRRATDLPVMIGRQGDLFGDEKLDFLTGGGSLSLPGQERSPLFKDDDDADTEDRQSVQMQEADDMEQLATMEAIQEALSSILAGGDELASDRDRGTPEEPSPEQSLSMPGPMLSPRNVPTSEPQPGGQSTSLREATPSVESSSAVSVEKEKEKRPFWHLRSVSGRSEPGEAQTSTITAVAGSGSAAGIGGSGSESGQPGKDRDAMSGSGEDLASSIGSLRAQLGTGPGTDSDVLSGVAQPSSGELDKLTLRIDKLQNQETVLSALLRKADLTGSTEEAKILTKSAEALRREIAELAFQKRQWTASSSAAGRAHHRLMQGRTSVAVVGTTVGQSEDGKEFALYLVEVRIAPAIPSVQSSQVSKDEVDQSQAEAEAEAVGWLVTRRFSEFVALHASLRDNKAILPSTRAVLDRYLPAKRLVGSSMSAVLLAQRRAALERYLQALVGLPGACDMPEVQAFLSQHTISLAARAKVAAAAGAGAVQGAGLLKNLFRSVTEGMDDLFGGPSVLDSMILRLSQQAADFAGSMSLPLAHEDLISSVFGSGVTASGITARDSSFLEDVAGNGSSASAPIDLLSPPSSGLGPSAEGAEGLTSFTAPIANLLVEVFDLKDSSSWLRRQAIVIILQQVLGGTIERRVREAVSTLTAGDALAPHVRGAMEMLWPGGKARPPSEPRTQQDKDRTREAALRKLNYLMPGEADLTHL